MFASIYFVQSIVRGTLDRGIKRQCRAKGSICKVKRLDRVEAFSCVGVPPRITMSLLNMSTKPRPLTTILRNEKDVVEEKLMFTLIKTDRA
jgi:hypothetical protein